MANDVFTIVADCDSCVKAKGIVRKHQNYLKLFLAAGPLEFLAMDLLCPLPKTNNGNKHVLVITDRFSKICRAVPPPNIELATVTQAFLKPWLYPYGVPLYIPKNNSPQFGSKIFASVKNLLPNFGLLYANCSGPPSGLLPRTILNQMGKWSAIIIAYFKSYATMSLITNGTGTVAWSR